MQGKKVLLISMAAIVALMGISFLLLGYEKTWRIWNIPVMTPSFADARVMTAGTESYRLGLDPLKSNPADPWGRADNYPRIWQILCRLGVDQRYTNLLGASFATLFILGVIIFLPAGISTKTAMLLLIAIFSPAVLLGVERGNNDLTVFFLLAVAIVLMNRFARTSALVIFIAFILKLFPIFASISLIRQRKSVAIRLMAILFCLAAVYGIATLDDLRWINQQTPRSTFLSYGVDTLWMKAAEHQATAGQIARILSYLFLLGGGLWGLRGLWSPADVVGTDETAMNAFRVGAGVYLGSFLLGSNCDYRLVFLLFTLPQLSLWAAEPDGKLARVSRVVIAAMLSSMWYQMFYRILFHLPAGDAISFLLAQLGTWTTFFGLLYALCFSAPNWLKIRGTVQVSPC